VSTGKTGLEKFKAVRFLRFDRNDNKTLIV